jgi:hypothetical protein
MRSIFSSEWSSLASPNPEYVGPFDANNLPNRAPAVSGLAGNLLERHAIFRQRQNSCVGLLPAKIALILDALGGGEQLGINCRRTDPARTPPSR